MEFFKGDANTPYQQAAMKVLLASSLPSSSNLISNLPPKTSFTPWRKTISPFGFTYSTKSLPSLSHHFHILSPPSSSSSSSSSTITASPEVESRDSQEKFDWFENWYAIAPVCDLDKRVPHGKKVMGLDVVVWWDKVEKRWLVFDDACPHRLAPLSEGRIDAAGRLQCAYHGWCFGSSGDCKFIPQAPPDGPQVHTSKRACASVYPSCEQNKIVWFWPSTDPEYRDILSKKKPPYIPELDDPSYTSIFVMRDFPYGYEILMENLVDPAHVPYAHYGIMPVAKNVKRNSRERLDREGGKPLDLAIKNLDATGFLAKQEYGSSRFIAPSIFYASPRWVPPKTNGSISNEAVEVSMAGEKRRVLVFICIPVSSGHSRLIWAFPRNFSVWMDRLLPRWIFHLDQNLVVDSDLYLLHVEEQKIAEVGTSNWQNTCYIPTKSDALVVGFRRWLKKYGGDQVPWGPKLREGGLLPSPSKQQLMDRYLSHVVQCSSCSVAEKGLKALEMSLQVLSLGLIGVVAAMKKKMMSSFAKSGLIFMAIACFLASKWLTNFIYKSFHFHDYNHALK